MEMVSAQLPNSALYSSLNVLNAENGLFRIKKKHTQIYVEVPLQYI
jgi:hypothetical protein